MSTPAARIAIIGYGCRLPGGVVDGPSFWQLLCDARDAIREVPADRWNARAFSSPRPGIAGTSASRWGGFLEDIEQFEPECFGISPREAAFIDPQQRLLLETTWEALEHAGLPLQQLAGSRTGVFVGISTSDYARIQATPSQMRELSGFTAQGTSFSIAANRISYCLDLRGPSFIVDTACSSSLVALDRAAKSLRDGESDLALVGGVNVIITPDAFISFSAASMLSPDGRSKAFDASANGFVRAEGAGMVVLKRLDDALRDGDRIQALLLATGVNQDGRTSGISMPNVDAQEALLREVYADAGIRPDQVRYVEAHGTGTAIGDPIEAEALGRVFGPGRRDGTPLIIGSVKTNTGHLEAASGMASLLKTVLMVQKRRVPPNLHFRTPNPNIPFDRLQLRVPVTLEPWPGRRQAVVGINSFGFGGTNAHAIVAEFQSNGNGRAPRQGQRRTDRQSALHAGSSRTNGSASQPDVPLLLTARSGEALRLLAGAWLSFLEQAEAAGTALGDIASTAAVRRSHDQHRLGLVASGFDEARDQLRAFLANESSRGIHCGERRHQAAEVAFVFCGQGPQRCGMGRELLASEPVFREAVERCDALFQPLAGWSLVEEIGRDEPSSRLHETSVAQPALFALQVGLAELWKSWGVEPAAVVGHSVGELAAAYTAGALSLQSAVRLIAHRGRCLEDAALPGRMLAAAMSESAALALIQEIPGQLGVAAVNSPEMLTLAGETTAIEVLSDRLSERGIWCRALSVGHAFHTPLVEPAREPFLRALQAIEHPTLRCEMISTVTGQPVNGQPLDAAYWWENIRRPVRFADAILELRQRGLETFVEIGPHPVLSSAIRQCRPEGATAAVVWPSLERSRGERRTMLSSLTGLFTAGTSVDWRAIWPEARAGVELPRHPWIRQRYWHECAESRGARLESDYHPLLGHRMPGADRRWQVTIDPAELTWLNDHRVGGRTIYPAAAFVEMALAAAMRTLGTTACTLDDLSIGRALLLPETAAPTVQVTVDRGAFALAVSSRVVESEDAWAKHCEASFRRAPDGSEAVQLELARWQREAAASLPGSVVYDAYHAMGMEFGPAFQGIVEVMRCAGSALGRVELAAEAGSDEEAYCIHPALLDSCFQVLLETLPAETRTAEAIYLPERIDRVRYWQPPGQRVWSEVRLRSASPSAVTGDIRIFRESGELAIDITGFQCRSLPRPRDRARPPVAACIYRTRWHHRPLPLPGATGQPLIIQAEPRGTSRGGLQRLVRFADAAAKQVWHDRSPRDVEDGLDHGDRLALAYVVRALMEIGVSSARRGRARMSREVLVGSETVIDRFRPQWERFIQALVETGGAEPVRTDRWRLIDRATEGDLGRLWQELLARHPERYPFYRLIEICGVRLPALWCGAVDPLEVLFSSEAADLLEQIYRDDDWTRYANAFIGQLLAQLVEALPEHRPLRILEVGAGTGGTTSAVLPMLPAERTDYWFTDTSPFFLPLAEEKFRRFEFVRYQRLDLEADFAEQGIEPGSFDVVIAADVLHAVRDVRAAVGRCRMALVEGGLLIARELSSWRVWLDLVFGLTESWWNYRSDPARPGGPLLTASEWSSLLQTDGFERPVTPAACEDATFATVFAARRSPDRPSGRAVPALVRTDAMPPEPDWIVFGDRQGHSQRIASQLRERGLRCLEITAGERFKSTNADSWCMDLGREQDRQRLAELCRREFAGDYAAIHLASLDAPQADDPAADALASAESLACHSLVHVLQALASSTTGAPRRLLLVTSGAREFGSGRGAPALLPAGLIGIGRVAANEFGAVAIRMIDLDPDDPQRLDALWTEMVFDDAEEEVAWCGSHRFVPRLGPVADAASRPVLRRRRHLAPFQVACRHPGDLDSLELRQTKSRRPGPDDVEVEVHFGALNFRDVLKALGRHPADHLRQLELGDECAGVVRRVGNNVRAVQPGARVVICRPGAFQSVLTVPQRVVMPIPDHLSLQSAVSMPIAFLTADYALREVGRLSEGETVLIHSAAGGVGLAAVQIARRLGARIFGTAGTPAKRDLLHRLGVERVMDSRSLAFCDQVLAATGQRGVDVVLNSLAGQAMVRSLACLAPGGRFLEIGKRDFYENTRVGLWPFRRNVSYHAIDLAAILLDGSAAGLDPLRALFGRTSGGELAPLPVRILPVAQAAEAFRLMAHGAHVGKLVLDVTQHGNRVRRDPGRFPIRANATYLVTGAFGGIGLTVARWLADRGARNLVLISRSGPQTGAARQAVDDLRREGRDVRAVLCDVTDVEQLGGVFQEIDRDMPPLAGVFHLAMVIDDGTILNLDAERFRRSMAPKIGGAWNLHRLTCARPLDCFVLFSSISAAVGNFGQASYAAANAALERLAEYRRARSLPATAIAWGMLGDVGYVAERPELAHSLSQLGFSAMTPDDVRQTLEITLDSDEPVSLAARIDWQKLTRKFAGHKERSNLLSELFSGAEDLPAAERGGRAAEAILSAAPADRPALVSEYVRNAAARVLGMAPARISSSRPLAELGLDSLMAVELASQIESDLGLAFPMNALGRDVTIDRVADVLSRELGGAPEPAAAPARPGAERAVLDRCLVHLSGAANRRPLFCIHPAGGELNVYRSLAESLPDDVRLLGIQSRLMAGAEAEFGTLLEIAAACADLVRRNDPDGPHRLFGFSFGGLLALHTAQVLLDEGCPVEWVGLAETDPRWGAPGEQLPLLSAFLVELYEQMRRELLVLKDVPLEALRRDAPRVLERLLSAPPDDGSSVLMEWLSSSEYLRDDAPQGLAAQYLARVAVHLRLLSHARPHLTVNVPLHVWQAADGLVPGGFAWESVTDRLVRVRMLSGNHFGVMAPPHSQTIAGELAGLANSGSSS